MFALNRQAIDAGALRRGLASSSAGALSVFEGWVRNTNGGRRVLSLEYEAFEPLAKSEADRIIAQAGELFEIEAAVCVHRVGRLAVGDLAVWIGVTAVHRDAAFGACRFIIDEIKHRLPIWKKEEYTDGTSGWVDCQVCAEHRQDATHQESPGSGEQLRVQGATGGQRAAEDLPSTASGAGGTRRDRGSARQNTAGSTWLTGLQSQGKGAGTE